MRHSFIRIAALATAITVMAALPATAGAATTGGGQFGAATLTISVGQPTLGQKVVVDVPVTVSCTRNPTALPEFPQYGTGGQVTIIQAVGKYSTIGIAYLPSFACDGAPHTIALQVIADPAAGGLHFKKGQATIRASASATGFDANFMFGSDSVDTGWLPVSIK